MRKITVALLALFAVSSLQAKAATGACTDSQAFNQLLQRVNDIDPTEFDWSEIESANLTKIVFEVRVYQHHDSAPDSLQDYLITLDQNCQLTTFAPTTHIDEQTGAEYPQLFCDLGAQGQFQAGITPNHQLSHAIVNGMAVWSQMGVGPIKPQVAGPNGSQIQTGNPVMIPGGDFIYQFALSQMSTGPILDLNLPADFLDAQESAAGVQAQFVVVNEAPFSLTVQTVECSVH